MSKGNNTLKLNNKSDKVAQVNNVVSVTSNSGTYVKIDVPSHTQYNNDVLMLKAQFLFDTVNNVDLFNAIDETLVNTSFEVIGQEPMICNCIKIQDIIDFYANGVIQQFYDAFCSSHSDDESIVLARFLSAIGIEIWRNVECYGGIYSGKYMVSNLSRVKRLYKTKDFTKILKPYDCGLGYLYVKLCYNGKAQNVRVNRLVSITFYGEPTEKLDASHANGKPTDNRLFNLDFRTHSENMKNPLTLKKYKDTWTTKVKADKASASTLE